MNYDEAEKLYGALMRPKDAADKIGIKQPSINDYWKSGTLQRIKVFSGGKEKSFVIIAEVNQLIKKRAERVTAIIKTTRKPDGSITVHAKSDGTTKTITHPNGKLEHEAKTLKALKKGIK